MGTVGVNSRLSKPNLPLVRVMSDSDSVAPVTLRVIAAASQDKTVTVTDESTIGSTRAEVAAIVGAPGAEKVKLTLRGRVLEDDLASWFDYDVKEGDKVYVAIDTSARGRQAMNNHGSVTANRSNQADASNPMAALEGGGAASPQMSAFVDNLSPEMIEMMFNMSPELRNLQRDHPDVARELRDPETFRNLMRSQMDPTSRRAAENARGMQMAQLGATPGGWQMAERLMHSIQRDDEREGADDASNPSSPVETSAQPVSGQSANNQALPNPWARPTQSTAAPQQPAPGAFPMGGAGLGGQQHQPGAGAAQPGPNPMAALMAAMMGQQQQARAQPPPPGARDPFTAMLMGMQPGPAAAAAPVAAPAPPDYSAQVRTLTEDMGFDEETARLALEQTHGDVDAAVNLIAEWTDE